MVLQVVSTSFWSVVAFAGIAIDYLVGASAEIGHILGVGGFGYYTAEPTCMAPLSCCSIMQQVMHRPLWLWRQKNMNFKWYAEICYSTKKQNVSASSHSCTCIYLWYITPCVGISSAPLFSLPISRIRSGNELCLLSPQSFSAKAAFYRFLFRSLQLIKFSMLATWAILESKGFPTSPVVHVEFWNKLGFTV